MGLKLCKRLILIMSANTCCVLLWQRVVARQKFSSQLHPTHFPPSTFIFPRSTKEQKANKEDFESVNVYYGCQRVRENENERKREDYTWRSAIGVSIVYRITSVVNKQSGRYPYFPRASSKSVPLHFNRAQLSILSH